MDEQIGQLISQGAEAKIYIIDYLGEKAILKQRLIKQYRHPTLDEELSNKRIIQEVRNMTKVRKFGINTPYIMYTDIPNRRIYMQYVQGIKVKDFLINLRFDPDKDFKVKILLDDIGKTIAIMHDGGIMHGDLTTSNMIIKVSENASEYKFYDYLYLIDFGLSYILDQVEHKAVDLYVLEKAFISTHPELENDYITLLQTYERLNKKGKEVILKLNEGNEQQQKIKVRSRGRKKLAFG